MLDPSIFFYIQRGLDDEVQILWTQYMSKGKPNIKDLTDANGFSRKKLNSNS